MKTTEEKKPGICLAFFYVLVTGRGVYFEFFSGQVLQIGHRINQVLAVSGECCHYDTSLKNGEKLLGKLQGRKWNSKFPSLGAPFQNFRNTAFDFLDRFLGSCSEGVVVILRIHTNVNQRAAAHGHGKCIVMSVEMK